MGKPLSLLQRVCQLYGQHLISHPPPPSEYLRTVTGHYFRLTRTSEYFFLWFRTDFYQDTTIFVVSVTCTTCATYIPRTMTYTLLC